ncbi:MAG: hypothetical protein LBH04_02300 [Tannerellaceae bacterium]|jgi:hypothetical protein|nr:hypothetical protein [Tannerellaceae bacterium]
MRGQHIIPQRDEDAVLWGENFTVKIDAHPNKYWIEQADVTELVGKFNVFKNYVPQAKGPESTHVIIVEKDQARKAFEEKARSIINYQLQNPKITDADRASLGLPIHDKTHTPIGIIDTYPILTAEAQGSRHLKLDFHDKDKANKAKPYGANGAVIAYEVLASPPAKAADLRYTALATRTPHILEFDEPDRGKTVYIAICWQNETGHRGPWSDIVSQIVP